MQMVSSVHANMMQPHIKIIQNPKKAADISPFVMLQFLPKALTPQLPLTAQDFGSMAIEVQSDQDIQR